MIKVASYIGNKWGGKYLRAPDIVLQLMQCTAGKFPLLRDLAHGERYLNTGGADGFFIVTNFERTGDRQWYEIVNTSAEGKEDGCPTFLIEADFLRPAIKSTDISSLIVDKPDALVLDIPPETNLNKTKAKHYVTWGESKGF